MFWYRVNISTCDYNDKLYDKIASITGTAHA